MVWNSTRFFFPAILVLTSLPLSPLLQNPSLFYALTILLCLLSWPKSRSKRLRELSLLCLFLLTLIGLRDARLHRIQTTRQLDIPEKGYVDLHGTIARQVQNRTDKGVIFLLSARSVDFRGQSRSLNGVYQVRLSCDHPPDGLVKGAEISLSAELTGLQPRYHFNLPDPARQVLAKGIDGYAFCKSPRLLDIKKPAPVWWTLWQNWRTHLNQTIEHLPFSNELGTLARPLFKSVFLGTPFQGDPLVSKQFMISGSLHLLAISGTHIALVTTACLLLFSWAPVSLRRLLCAIVILFYLLQAAAPISAQRAALVAWVWLWAAQRKRAIHMPHILGLAGCLDLLFNPFIVHSPSFLLTYIICFSLAWWSEWIGFTRGDPVSKKGWARPRVLLKTQLIATTTSTPLTLHLFNQTALAGLPAGLLLIPLFSLLLPLAAFSLLLFMIEPASFILTRWFLEPVLSLLNWLLRLFSHGEVLLFYRQAPSFWLISVCLGLFLLAGAAVQARWLRRLALGGVLLLLVYWLLPDTPFRPQNTEIIIPDIGQGEMQALVFPSGRSLLIDCGGAPMGDQRFVTRQIIAWLLNNRIHPEWIALSHFHADHCGSLPELLPIFKPQQIFISEQPRQNPLYVDARKAGSAATTWVTVAAPFHIDIDDASLTWLYPLHISPPETETRNGHSQVILLKSEAGSMLFCGDIGIEEEKILVEKYGASLKADILKVPHHGSRFSSSLPFIQAVSPRLAIFHCDRRNVYSFPHVTILSRYRELGIQDRCTWQGDLVLGGPRPHLWVKGADNQTIPGFFTPLVY